MTVRLSRADLAAARAARNWRIRAAVAAGESPKQTAAAYGISPRRLREILAANR